MVRCMEAVYTILHGSKPADWRTCQNMIRSPKFIEDLRNFDVENGINDVTINELEQYINAEDFKPNEVTKKSRAAGAFCQWAHGVYNYQLIKKAN